MNNASHCTHSIIPFSLECDHRLPLRDHLQQQGRRCCVVSLSASDDGHLCTYFVPSRSVLSQLKKLQLSSDEGFLPASAVDAKHTILAVVVPGMNTSAVLVGMTIQH
jgi:hypothetical protein